MNPVARQLILKDLFLTRWMAAGATAAGLAAIAIMPLGEATAYVAAVSLICILIVLNIFLAMGVAQEQRDKVLLFILSLPISPSEYLRAKVTANGLAFLIPWVVLTAGTAVLIEVSRIPDGILPFWVAILAYLLAYYFALLGVALVTESTAWHAAAIVAGNVSVNFLFPLLIRVPSIARHREGDVAVWDADIVAVIALEIAAGLAVLALAIRTRLRRPDFV